MLPHISDQYRIGLYHLNFLRQEEELQKVEEQTGGENKRKYKRHIKTINLMIEVPGVNTDHIDNIDSLQLIKVPLQESDLVLHKDKLIDDAVYLLVYTDEVEISKLYDLGSAKDK